MSVNTRSINFTRCYCFEDGLLVEFMDLVFTRMAGESHRRWLGSLFLYLCYVYRTLINYLVRWFIQIKTQTKNETERSPERLCTINTQELWFYIRVNASNINCIRGTSMYIWWSLCTLLYLHACQVRVTVGDSGLCCCTCVTYFQR